jgi:hypothetical protein
MWGSVREGAGLLESSPSRHRDAAVVSQARGVTGLVRLKPTPTRHSDATRLVVKEEEGVFVFYVWIRVWVLVQPPKEGG